MQSQLRRRVLRTARSNPLLSCEQIAAIVNCHPSSVNRHLKDAAAVPAQTAAMRLQRRCSLTQKRPVPGRLAADPDTFVREQMAANPTSPRWALARLLRDPQPAVRQAAAGNPHHRGLSPGSRLAADPSSRVRGPAARNYAAAAALRRLAIDTSPVVRKETARSPLCPADVLADLAADPDESVSAAAVGNSRCPPQALSDACENGSRQVRQRAARHRNCPPRLLKRLSKDEASVVRYAVVRNPRCPPRLLKRLAGDADSVVRDAAQVALVLSG